MRDERFSDAERRRIVREAWGERDEERQRREKRKEQNKKEEPNEEEIIEELKKAKKQRQREEREMALRELEKPKEVEKTAEMAATASPETLGPKKDDEEHRVQLLIFVKPEKSDDYIPAISEFYINDKRLESNKEYIFKTGIYDFVISPIIHSEESEYKFSKIVSNFSGIKENDLYPEILINKSGYVSVYYDYSKPRKDIREELSKILDLEKEVSPPPKPTEEGSFLPEAIKKEEGPLEIVEEEREIGEEGELGEEGGGGKLEEEGGGGKEDKGERKEPEEETEKTEPEEIEEGPEEEEAPPERHRLTVKAIARTEHGEEEISALMTIGLSTFTTPKVFDLPEGNYTVRISTNRAIFDGKGYSFVEWDDGSTADRTVDLSGDTTIVAYFEISKHIYKEGMGKEEGEDLYTGKRPDKKMRAMYEAKSEPLARGAASAVGGFSRMFGPGGPNPALRAAKNKGRRSVARKAEEIFERLRAEKDVEALSNSVTEKQNAYRKLEDTILKEAANAGGLGAENVEGIAKGGSKTNIAELGGLIGSIASQTRGKGGVKLRILMNKLSMAYNDLKKAEEDLKKSADLDVMRDPFKKQLDDFVDAESKRLGRRFKLFYDPGTGKFVGIQSPEFQELEADMKSQANDDMERLLAGYRSSLRGVLGRMASFSMRAKTVGDVFTNLKANLWFLLTGPWVVGTILFLAMLYVVIFPSSAGTVSFPLFMGYAGACAVLLFLVKFADSKYPLEFLDFLVSGALIGGGTAIILLSLGFGLSSITGLIFAVILVFLGVFQFYEQGGFKAIVPLAIIIIIFGWAAMGPYSGYVKEYTSMLKEPIIEVYYIAEDGFETLWLLGTNPSKWYSLQQQQNVRPETPVSFAKGIEITALDALPSSVPRGEEFTMAAVLMNQHDTQEAKNIYVKAECDDKCRIINNGQEIDKMEVKRFTKPMPFGGGDTVSFPRFKVTGDQRTYAHVDVTVGYEFPTSTALLVEVASNSEIIERQGKSGADIFRPVQAIGKVGPGQISLNVGPQPIYAGRSGLLLISILNTRKGDTAVVVPKGTKITIKAASSIVNSISCGRQDGRISATQWSVAGEYGSTIVTINTAKDVVVKSRDSDTIFSFLCDIVYKGDITASRTGIITAEMPVYRFEVKQQKTIHITEPLGITFAKCEDEGGTCRLAVTGCGFGERRPDLICDKEVDVCCIGAETGLEQYATNEDECNKFSGASCRSDNIVDTTNYNNRCKELGLSYMGRCSPTEVCCGGSVTYCEQSSVTDRACRDSCLNDETEDTGLYCGGLSATKCCVKTTIFILPSLTVETIVDNEVYAVTIQVDGQLQFSNTPISLTGGQHLIEMPQTVTKSGTIYIFDMWEDSYDSTTKYIDVRGDMTIAAFYEIPSAAVTPQDIDLPDRMQECIDTGGGCHTSSCETLGETYLFMCDDGIYCCIQ